MQNFKDCTRVTSKQDPSLGLWSSIVAIISLEAMPCINCSKCLASHSSLSLIREQEAEMDSFQFQSVDAAVTLTKENCP